MRLYKNQHGFTLLEVLVAFLIAAASMGVIYQIVAQGGSRTKISSNEGLAIMVAQSKLAEVQTGISSESGEQYGFEWHVYEKEQALPTTTDQNGLLQLKYVRVVVSWPESSQIRSIELETLLPRNF